MRGRIHDIVLAAVCLSLLALQGGRTAFGAEIVVSFDQANPPFMYMEAGVERGLYPAIIAEAFRRMGRNATVQGLPWKRVLAGADAGMWGIGGLYMNSKRLLKYDYSIPIHEERLVCYVLRGADFPFAGVSDLEGRTVGVMRGWTYGDAFDQAAAAGKINRSQTDDDISNFRMLRLGRVDVVISTPETWRLIRGRADPEGRVTELPTPFLVNKTYLSFPKSQGMGAVLKAFDMQIRTMRADGTLDRLVRENLHPDRAP